MGRPARSRRGVGAHGGHASEELLWPHKIWRYLHDAKQPEPERELLRRLAQGHSLHEARRWLDRLIAQGWVVRDRAHVSVRRVSGELRLNARGFGFVLTAEGPDIFIPARYLNGAVQGDEVTVWVRDNPEGRGLEGRVMGVKVRRLKQVVGRLERKNGRWVVQPQDERFPAVTVGQARGRPHFEAGTVAVAELVAEAPGPDAGVRGRVVALLGRPGDPGVDVDMVMAEHGLSPGFPGPVEAAASQLPDAVRPEDWAGRLDLTDHFIITIDGADAKDLDDAISVDVVPDGWRVGVHIADVSYYVTEHGPIDTEARKRGTSVYLVDRVVPMLPEALSNQIASLNPGVPRLTVTVWIGVSPTGEMTTIAFARSVIRSRHRLTYEAVNRVLAGEASASGELGAWLSEARRLADVLHRRRVARGAIDFDLPEPKVLLDPAGRVREIVARERGPAERLIEELMLLANEAVARTLLEQALPGIYRVHEEPADEKLQDFRTLVRALGLRLPAHVTPKALQRLLEKVKGTPEERVVTAALLRSMRQARYAPTALGHFGLATDHYTHFTSPIRRYPDLFVHRVLTAWMAGMITPAMRADWEREAPEVAEQSSERERQAMDAERTSVLVKQIQWMADKVGEEFSGVVSGVVAFGLFVSLDIMVDGLIRVEDLPADVYDVDPVHQTLTGRHTGRAYRLGDPIRVVVARVDEAQRRIDFVLPREPAGETARPRRPAGNRRPRRSGRARAGR
jgi:ribonuclease R